MKSIFYLALFVFVFPDIIHAQNNSPYTSRMYLAWGYNKEWFSKSTIKISQPSLGNNYELRDVSGNDKIGWDKLFNNPLTIPQYNVRFGFFLDKHPDWGFELNYDHTKFQLSYGQYAHLVGTVENKAVDTNILVHDNYLEWKLNNGANFILINIMKRYYITEASNGKLKFFVLFKAGIGPTYPHVFNILLGEQNSQHFQWGGWNTALEASYRLEFLNYIYLDLSQKVDYARYSGLRIYEGTAKQSFSTYEIIGTIGFMLPFKSTKAN